MRIDRAGGGVKTRIRDAVEADAAVVVWDVFDHPVDGVVGIGRFVDRCLLVLGDLGSDLDKLAFAHPPPTHILVNKDVSLSRKESVRPEARFERVLAVRGHGIWRAVEHDRVTTCDLALRLVDSGKQLYAIAHR